VGKRCRVVGDVRVVIAKMLWEEAWQWGELAEDRSESNGLWSSCCDRVRSVTSSLSQWAGVAALVVGWRFSFLVVRDGIDAKRAEIEGQQLEPMVV
jgi:hypothetical protein